MMETEGRLNREIAGDGAVTYATMPWGVGVRVASCLDVIRTARKWRSASISWWNPLTWFGERAIDCDWYTEYRVTLPGKGQEFYEQVKA